MKNTKIRAVSLILACALALPAFTACTAENTEAATEETEAEITADETTGTAKTEASPETTAPETESNEEETTNSPEVTKTEETTKAPETTKTEETTKAPETTKAEETTKAPETTKAEETTKAPETTKAEETTKAPEKEEPKPAPCAHSSKVVKNKKSATCTKAGYTGDTYCKSCNKLLSYGSTISKTAHTKELRNEKEATITSEGYTGDVYCMVCNTKIASGEKTPKLPDPDKVTYTTSNGFSYTVDKDTDIMAYTMALRTKKVNSPYREAELEVLRLCNIERAKVGAAPLEWYEDAYYFAHIRAEELYIQWGHPRPDWSPWHTVYTDVGVILAKRSSENIAQFEGYSAYTNDVAEAAVRAWMNSPAHRDAILDPKYTKMVVAFEYGSNNFTLSAAQHFFE